MKRNYTNKFVLIHAEDRPNTEKDPVEVVFNLKVLIIENTV